MQHDQGGFTLLELMVVVVIVGILAAIAVAVYQGNVAKSQVNRVVSEVGAYRTAFETGLTNNSTINNASLGYSPSQLTTGTTAAEIATTNPDGSGHLQVTMGGSAHGNLSGLIIRFERTSVGEWSCIIDTSATSGWKTSYIPSGCTVI